MNVLKQAVVAVTISVLACTSYADPAPNSSFQSQCVDAWMKKADQATDKVDYKNFGEKYCGCAAAMPLDNDQAIQKAIQQCMSRTLLHDAMDSLDEEVGLSDAKDTDVDEYCQDRWNLIYPNQTDADKKVTGAYCECAKPKLLDLIKQSDNMTEKQYNESIDSIAASCSGSVKEEQPTTAPATTPAQ
ncbi:hypothetical protein [Legionella shakespearei]|uniref:Uncharacterized protein n=1 Tax=Legionella shakespearei DSM 23087 TaxID=1122169 RepID=A0A0W0ZAS0_9GAMM|nr:hypothetical protein [Legionella shakespearei]KTD66235.1 hypothetical protein Lsha_0129 [Legionella shakespearei DSM 23087]